MTGFRTIANPEVSVRATTVVMQIRNIDGFTIENTDITAAETVRQSRKLGKYLQFWYFQIERYEDVAEIDLKYIT